MLNVFHREGRAIRHFWGSELFYAPADQGQEPATSAPLSRCGTCSTSPARAAQPTGMSSSATDQPGNIDEDGWPTVVAAWVPRLMPALRTALFHGAIRTAQTATQSPPCEASPGSLDLICLAWQQAGDTA
jgi:hypothetical protein